MRRRDLLKSTVLGIGSLSVPAVIRAAGVFPAAGATRNQELVAGCWATPEETQGPFYFDPGLIRQDVREGRAGVLLDLTITVIDNTCDPHFGVLFDLWQCDKDGCYSGYNQPTCSAVGQTFLRGTQISDGGGVVRFRTIYPGWYPGRATHIHFKVRTPTTTYKTSQFAFPEWANAEVYASPLYVGRGPNPTSNEEDGVFGAEEPLHQIVDLTGNPTNGYLGTYTAGVEEQATAHVPGAGSPSAMQITGFPAPFREDVTLHAMLPSPGFATISIYDTLGRRNRILASGYRSSGPFDLGWDGRDDQGRVLPAGVYIALLEIGGQNVFTRLVRVK